jgi:dihydroxy-acid dehydratase
LYAQQIIRPLDNPIKTTGHIQILYGNLAPEGSVAKITGKEGLYFSGKFCSFHPQSLEAPIELWIQPLFGQMPGPALVFEGEESMIAAISENPSDFKVIHLHLELSLLLFISAF